MNKKLLPLFTLIISSFGVFCQTFAPGGGFTDAQGNQYNTIIINGQEWSQENLAVTVFSNGDPIANVTDGPTWSTLTTPAYAIYNNDPIYDPYYGKLYNWYVVNDARNVCPSGWHVPTDNDWKLLEAYLGMTQTQIELNNTWRGTNEGNELKETFGWNTNTGTNVSGFSALPGGRRNPNGNFSDLGNEARYWTSTGALSLPYQVAYERGLMGIYPTVYRTYTDINGGMYIRCLSNTLVSVDEQQEINFTIYPNPASSSLSINFSQEIVNSVYGIFDITGKKVLSGTIEATSLNIDISELENGVYTIKIEGLNQIKRFVKQ